MKQIFEIDCENEQITAKFLSDYLKNHFDTLAYNDSYLERRAVYVGHHHTRRHFKVDIKVKEITSALQHLNMLRNKTHPPKKRVTIDTEGEEFKQAVRKIADEVRVKAEKTKCRFDNMVSVYCKGVEAEAKERVKERERSEAAEKDYAEMLSKSQSGAPFDEYGYDKMKAKSQSKNIKVCICDTFPCTCGAIDNQEILYKLSQGNYSATYYVHKTAIIESGVVIRNGTKIWHHSHVCWGAHIGNNCTIGDNVYIGKNVYIGNNCKIQNNVYIPEGVEIEHDVFLGPGATFTNILNPRATISRKEEFKSTVVEIGASIGANATILCDNVIGRYAMIGAGAVVTKDVDEFKVAFGNPAEVVGIISKDGSDINYYGWRY